MFLSLGQCYGAIIALQICVYRVYPVVVSKVNDKAHGPLYFLYQF